ncbi:MAG: hypothetical protein KF887_07375 [Paracoccaceae bacterium]|nr:MAG: hypothetical protein KF887_07375 [Paracoccaceae bacterium]
MAIVNTNLTFFTQTQSLWRPGPATDLTIDSGNILIWDPDPIVEQFGFSALGFSLDAEFYLDVKFGLLAYASLGTGGHFDAEYNISVAVELPTAVIAGNTMAFDFRNFSVTSSSITTAGFGTPESSGAGKIGAGLDLIIKLETGFRDVVFGHWFGEEGPHDFTIFDVDERIELIAVSPLNPEFSLDLTEGVTLTARLPTGASIRESTASNGGGRVSGEGVSDRQFLSLDADLDALLVRLLNKIPAPPVQVVAKFLGEVVFAEHTYDLNSFLPFIGKGKAAFNFTLLDITANAGLNVTEEVSLDINRPGTNTPDIIVTLVSDNGTPGNAADDIRVRGALGQVLTLMSPNTTGVGDAIITATYEVNRASFFHGVGVGINASITIDALSGYLTGSWVPEALRFSFGPLFSTQIPDGGFQINLGNLYEDTFEVSGSAFNTEVRTYEVFYVEQALAPTGYNPDLPNAEETLYAYFRASHEQLAAIQATYSDNGFLLRPPLNDPPASSYDFSGEAQKVMFIWTGLFDQTVTLNSTNGSVATVDLATTLPSNAALLSGQSGGFLMNSVVNPTTAYAALEHSSANPNDSALVRINGKTLTTNASINYEGTANNDFIFLYRNDTSFINGGGQLSGGFDTFMANFAAHYGDVAIRWDLNASVTAENDSDPNTAGGITLFDNDPSITTLTVRNIERAILRTGAADDYLVGWQRGDIFITGDGDDIVIMPVDSASDVAMLEGGDDVYIGGLRATADTVVDVIYGGTGIDNAFVTAGTAGLRYDITAQGFDFGPSGIGLRFGDTFGIGADASFGDIAQFYFDLGAWGYASLASDPGSVAADLPGGGANLEPEYAIVLRNGFTFGQMQFDRSFEYISIVEGGAGDDLAIFLGGTRYEGGDGTDTFGADFRRFEPAFGARAGVNIVAGRTGIDGFFGETIIDGFERLLVAGTSANDVLVGGMLSDFLFGDEGNDVLSGGADKAADALFGGDGNDFIVWTNAGADDIRGGAGIDRLDIAADGLEAHGLRYRFVSFTDGLILPGSEVFYWAYDSAALLLDALDYTRTLDTFYSMDLSFENGVFARTYQMEVANIRGSVPGDDVLIYQGGVSYIGGETAGDQDTFVADLSAFNVGITFVIKDDEALDGSDGYTIANTIYVEGIDRGVLITGAGNDLLVGGRLDDYFHAGAGADTLIGGAGNNVLIGGEGNDLFMWDGAGNDTIVGGSFRDLNGRDVLVMAANADAQATLRVFLPSGVELTASGALHAGSSHEAIRAVVDQALFASRFIYDTGAHAVDYSNISRVEFAGDGFRNDIALFQYGENYIGGDDFGDLFAGDFRFKVNPGISFGDMIFDARTSKVYEAAEGLKLGGFERFHLLLGDGTHLVRGGDLGDHVEGTTGYITFLGGTGDDYFAMGTGGGLFEHVGGNDTVIGSFGRSTLVYQAEGPAQIQLLNDTTPVGPLLSRQTGLQSITVFDDALSSDAFTFLLTHQDNSLRYSGIREVFATGSGQNDVLLGGFGQTLLDGGDGDDVLIVRQGNHVMTGGAGQDTYVFDDLFGSAVILDEFGTDTILMFTGVLRDQLSFSADGLDLLVTTSPTNIIPSNLRFQDYFAPGPNGVNATFVTMDDSFTLDLSGFGAFTGLAVATRAVLHGTAGNDDFSVGNHVGRIIHMGAGDDFADAGSGADLFFGGSGQDGVSYRNSAGGVSVDLGFQSGTGNDAEGDIYSSIEHVAGSVFDDLLVGSAASNTLVADEGDDTLFGSDGDDALFGGTGEDSLDGGNDNDLLDGGEGDDTLLGGTGNDILRGGDGRDSLNGGEGDDLIETGNGNDRVNGGNGNDVIVYVGDGRDTINGGVGIDWVDFSLHTAGVSVDLLAGTPVLSSNGVREIAIASLANIENLRGTDFDDQLIGNAQDNVIDGGLGFNVMVGHAGADTFISTGRLGFVDYSQESGGQGIDLVFQAFTPGLSPHVAGTDSHGNTDRLFNITIVQGTRFADNIQGNDDDNELIGGDGGDFLNGLNGNDILFGEFGNDTLLGFFGNDTLLGGEGSNSLRGEDGNDVLIADFFTTFDHMIGGAGFDTALYDQFETGLTITGSQVFANGVQIGLLDGIEHVAGGLGDDVITLSAPDQSNPSNREFLQVYSYTGGLDEVTGTNVFLGGRNTLSYALFDAAMHVRMSSGIARTDDAPTITGDGTRRATLFDDIMVVVGSRHGDFLEGNVMRPLGQSITFSELHGGDGNDTLVGLGGDTVLIGGAGDDLIRIFVPPFDPQVQPPIFFYTVDGGEGVDSLQIDGLTGWDIDLTASYANLFITGIENVIGSTGDDTLTGDAGANTFRGGLGDDVFFGGDGDDTLIYTSGVDTFTGGAGIDTLDLSAFTSAARVDLRNLSDTARTNDLPKATGGVFRTIVTAPDGDVEGVVGTAFNDSIAGDELNNFLSGGLGNDTLRGRAGNDLLIYDAGLDLLDGGADRDTASFAGFQFAIDLDLTHSGISVFHRGGTTVNTGTAVNIATLVSVENVIGTAQSDVLRGDDEANAILGNGGADLIMGRGGEDSLFGGDLSDTLLGDDGNDSIVGGITETDLGDSIDGGAGNDTVFGGAGNDTILGGDGDDQLRGDTGNDSIDGGVGSDFIAGGRGRDTLHGGDGDGLDTLSGGDGDDVLIGGAGASSVQEGGSGNDLLTGGTGADTLRGGDGNDTLVGGSFDSIDGGNGFDIVSYATANVAVSVELSDSGFALTGGAAQFDQVTNVEGVWGGLRNDVLTGNAAQNLLRGGEGNDTLTGNDGDDMLDGDGGRDMLYGGAGRDRLRGGDGNDRLSGGGGADELYGDAGDDSLKGEDGSDLLVGGIGLDTLDGGAGDDTLQGGDDADILLGGDGNDLIEGGAGNDTLRGGPGGDLLNGGDGTDFADYGTAKGGVTVNLAAPERNRGEAVGDRYISIENIIGSAKNDRLTGDGLANMISAGKGRDTLEGGGGTDTLFGGEGNDLFITTGESIDAESYGGDGDDTFVFSNAFYSGNIFGGAGTDHVDVSAYVGFTIAVDLAAGTYDDGFLRAMVDIENVTGGTGNDTLGGSAANNRLIGGAGDDLLSGEAGNDTLDGGAGFDTMLGGAGNDLYIVNSLSDRVFETTTTTSTVDAGGIDTIQSSVSFNLNATVGTQYVERLTLTGTQNINATGNDLANVLIGNARSNTINGGLGSDTMTGGAGADTFVFDTAPSATNRDVITDFSVVDDTIRLDDAVFVGLAQGVLAASAFTANLTGLATDPLHRLIYETDTGRVFFDANGTGAGARSLIVTLAADLALTHEDFFVF